VIPSVKTPAAVGQLELGDGFEPIELGTSSDGSPYASALLLARRDGENLGLVRVVARDGILEPDELRVAFDEQLPGWDGESQRRLAVPRDCHVTVVVTARGRHEELAATLQSVFECDWGSFDVVVVDSGPDAGSADFLRERFGAHPQLRCVVEPREGASYARNAGLSVAQGEVVAFTDEGAEVDESWIRALVAALEETGAECVTGPALPLELETPAQALAAGLTGSTNESTPRTLSLADNTGERLAVRVAEQLGPGLNLAVRADTLRALGGFDPALGPGTIARGGEDLDLYIRLLRAGHAVGFQPDALVWRGLPRELQAVKRAAFTRGMSLGVAISKHVHDGNKLALELRAAARHIRRRAARPDNPRRTLLETRALTGLIAAPLAYSQSVRAQARLPARPDGPTVVLEPPPAPPPVSLMPDEERPVTPRWADVGLAALIAGAVAVTLVPAPVTVRILVMLAAACLVPGGALVRYLRFDFGASWLAMAAALSLGVETLASLALIWTGWWHPELVAIALGAISALVIVFDWSRHRGAGPALPA
jgi:glycosyltransferase involved in cell wall biosynthesis